MSNPVGRPSKYSLELAENICDQIADGRSLRRICDQDEMPDRRTVLRWLESDTEFAAKYARAREAQADAMDDLILSVADECTTQTAAADRVKIDAYKWRAAKLRPKVYGDRIEQHLTGSITHKSEITDADLEAIATGSRSGAAGT